MDTFQGDFLPKKWSSALHTPCAELGSKCIILYNATNCRTVEDFTVKGTSRGHLVEPIDQSRVSRLYLFSETAQDLFQLSSENYQGWKFHTKNGFSVVFLSMLIY